MSKPRKPRRSAQEILAELKEREENLRTRMAVEAASSNPAFKPIMNAIGAIDTELRESSKLLGDGPQGCASRERSHQLWIEEIRAQSAHASLTAKHGKSQKVMLQSGLAKLVSTIANGGKVNPKDVNGVLSAATNLKGQPEVTAALVTFDDAQKARKAHTVAKKEPRRIKQDNVAG